MESLTRVTPKERVPAALDALGEASAALADGRYRGAVRHAERAKELAPSDATVRETLGVAAYRAGDWVAALRELRTFRRMSGETTHLPAEIDAARAMGRDAAVENAWKELQRRGGKPAVMKEGRVVYASYLLDRGELDQAWNLVKPEKLGAAPFPADLRLWYVAARAAAKRRDPDEAQKLRNVILEHDPGFPGIDELESLIADARS